MTCASGQKKRASFLAHVVLGGQLQDAGNGERIEFNVIEVIEVSRNSSRENC